jgi:FtsP/CotA-like multicopper oxidase with cupredoxin domain
VSRGSTRRDFLCRTGLAAGAIAAESTLGPVARVAATPAIETTPGVREYWVAAVNKRWGLSPARFDDWGNVKVPRRTYDALCYVAMTPGWGQPLPAGGVGDNTGIPGPVLRASPGDRLVVHFKNLDAKHKMPHTMHPHGVHYTPEHDGAYIGKYTTLSGAVPYGKDFTYEWEVKDDSVGVWPYHDHGPMEMEATELGLYGTIVIRPKDEPKPDVESTIWFGMLNPFTSGLDRSYSLINGRAFAGNTPTVRAKAGQTVAWNVLTLGNEIHTFHIHGHRWQEADRNFADAPMLGPAQGLRATFQEDAPGRWLYHCHVMEHMHHGMVGYYVVDPA